MVEMLYRAGHSKTGGERKRTLSSSKDAVRERERERENKSGEEQREETRGNLGRDDIVKLIVPDTDFDYFHFVIRHGGRLRPRIRDKAF